MALFKSALLTQASGSVGGVTFAHAAGGMYMRARAIPVNPNTALQGAVKAALTTLVNRWNDTLSAAERASWDLYAANVVQTNPLGTPFFQSGQNAYIQANSPRLFGASATLIPLPNLPLTGALAAAIDTGPAIFNRGTVGVLSIDAAVASTGLITVSFIDDIEGDWPATDDTALLLWLSRPRSPARNFFRGPYRLAVAILGNTAIPITSPQVFPAVIPGYTFAAGERIRLSGAVIRVDGRYTSRVESNDFTATA